MASSGMARKIDSLGRIVLPAEMRKQLDIGVGDLVDISVEGRHFVLEKVEQHCVFCGAAEGLREHQTKLICAPCVKELSLQSGD